MSDFPVPGETPPGHPDFPYAPVDWSREEAEQIAQSEEIELNGDTFDLVKSLQEYYSKNKSGSVNVRELCDALEEKFHTKGGMKYLYKLFPGGPIAQGCRIAGLEMPAGAIDKSFGSVQ